MPAQSEKRIFTYQTRVTLTPDQHRALADYAALFCRVERTLHADLQSGKPAELLKSEYLLRFAITARQFNAAKIQLQGKVKAIRELLPLQIEDLKTKIKKAKKTIAKLVKRVPGSEIVHLKKRRLAGLECRLKQREADRKSCRVRLCFGSRKLFHAQFDLQANGLRSHEEWLARCWQGGERSVPTSLYWAPRTKREGVRDAWRRKQKTGATHCGCAYRMQPGTSTCSFEGYAWNMARSMGGLAGVWTGNLLSFPARQKELAPVCLDRSSAR